MALHNTIPDAEKLLFNIQYAVKSQVNRGLDKAAEKLIERLNEKSPSNKKTTKNKYRTSWKMSRRYRYMRIIYNTKTVSGSRGEIPLVNILEADGEYASDVFEGMRDELADIILSEIQFD